MGSEWMNRALELLNEVVLGSWNSKFDEIELTAVVEANRIVAIAQFEGSQFTNPIDPQLLHPFDMDVRISMAWDTVGINMTGKNRDCLLITTIWKRWHWYRYPCHWAFWWRSLLRTQGNRNGWSCITRFHSGTAPPYSSCKKNTIS